MLCPALTQTADWTMESTSCGTVLKTTYYNQL